MSTTEIATQENTITAKLIFSGDMSGLNPDEKAQYYQGMCKRIGLDPFAQPFQILRIQNRQMLYLTRAGAQQLNRLHSVSHQITARENIMDCYVVTARAYTPDNRQTESIGAVPLKGLQGEALCNAFMKAETKAKRRSTLDLLGLGILDESETSSIPGAQTMPIPARTTDPKPEHTRNTPEPEAAPAVITKKQSDLICKLVRSHVFSDEERDKALKFANNGESKKTSAKTFIDRLLALITERKEAERNAPKFSPEELREKAKRIRERAQYAESGAEKREEDAEARELDRTALLLETEIKEGIAPKTPAPVKKPVGVIAGITSKKHRDGHRMILAYGEKGRGKEVYNTSYIIEDPEGADLAIEKCLRKANDAGINKVYVNRPNSKDPADVTLIIVDIQPDPDPVTEPLPMSMESEITLKRLMQYHELANVSTGINNKGIDFLNHAENELDQAYETEAFALELIPRFTEIYEAWAHAELEN